MSLPRKWAVACVAALLLSIPLVAFGHDSSYCGHDHSGVAYRTVFLDHWNVRHTIVRDDGSVWYYSEHRHKYGHGPHLSGPWDHIRKKTC